MLASATEGVFMGETIALTAGDGHKFGAYEEKPAGTVRGGLVVIQEIFGVNAHMRRVAGGYVADGYRVIAPAIFDRAERGVELGYSKPEMERGVELRKQISTDAMRGAFQDSRPRSAITAAPSPPILPRSRAAR
jgi:carboxymethylenebutenolidase